VHAGALVEPRRAGRVLRVDAEHALVEPTLAQLDERRCGDGPSETPPAPRPPDADVLEPATLDAKPLVLLRPDPVLDDARDLVAIPGDDPQVGVELRAFERRLVGDLARLAVTPVVAERLVLGVEDLPPLVLGDGTDLDPLGQRRRGIVEPCRA
jgi:hypothetical protein